MKKLIVTLLLGATVLASGCSTLHSSQYNGPLNVTVEANLKADIEVGDKITGTASGTNIMWLFNVGMPTKFADGVSFGASTGKKGFGLFAVDTFGRMKAAAAYDAITKSGADVIVAPKYIVDYTDYFFYKSVNVTVTGYKGTIKKIN